MNGSEGDIAPSLVKKLGITDGVRLALIDAPEGFAATLGELPEGVTVRHRAQGPADVILAFFDSRARLEHRFPVLAAALTRSGGLWIAWPKRASGMPTDLTEGGVRATGLAAGLVDNKICAVDDTWSALRFVYRVADRGRLGMR